MEREKLISEIAARLGQTSVSSRTIGDVVDFAPLAEGVEPDEAYYAKVTKLLGSFGGNINNYTASQTKAKEAEIESLKAKVQELEKKPTEAPENETIKALIERLDKIDSSNKALNEELAQFKGKQAQEVLKAAVVGSLKQKCDNESVLDLALQTYGDFDTTKTSEAIAAEVETKYNALIRKLYGDGPHPRGGNDGQKPLTTEQAKQAQDDFREALIRSGRLPKPNNA